MTLIPRDIMDRAARAKAGSDAHMRKLDVDRVGAGDDVEKLLESLKTRRVSDLEPEAVREERRTQYGKTAVLDAAELIPILSPKEASRHRVADPVRQALVILQHDDPTPFRRFPDLAANVQVILVRRAGEIRAAEEAAETRRQNRLSPTNRRRRFSGGDDDPGDYGFGGQ